MYKRQQLEEYRGSGSGSSAVVQSENRGISDAVPADTGPAQTEQLDGQESPPCWIFFRWSELDDPFSYNLDQIVAARRLTGAFHADFTRLSVHLCGEFRILIYKLWKEPAEIPDWVWQDIRRLDLPYVYNYLTPKQQTAVRALRCFGAAVPMRGVGARFASSLGCLHESQQYLRQAFLTPISYLTELMQPAWKVMLYTGGSVLHTPEAIAMVLVAFSVFPRKSSYVQTVIATIRGVVLQPKEACSKGGGKPHIMRAIRWQSAAGEVIVTYRSAFLIMQYLVGQLEAVCWDNLKVCTILGVVLYNLRRATSLPVLITRRPTISRRWIPSTADVNWRLLDYCRSSGKVFESALPVGYDFTNSSRESIGIYQETSIRTLAGNVVRRLRTPLSLTHDLGQDALALSLIHI